jgi:ankyrin repeat protein
MVLGSVTQAENGPKFEFIITITDHSRTTGPLEINNMCHSNKRQRSTPPDISQRTQRKKCSARNLPVEIWGHIAGFLPPAYFYSISISKKYPNYLSAAALGLGFHRRGFAALEPERQLSILKDLYTLKEKDLFTLKCLLRLAKIKLDLEFTKLLLDEAVLHNDEGLACLSIAKGRGVDYTTGLVLAVKYEKYDMIDHFLARGADVALDDYMGQPSSLRTACDRQDTQLIKMLLSYGESHWTELHAAVSYGCYDMVTNLQGCQKLQSMKDMEDIYGRLPIHFAIYSANFEMLKLLKQYGCDIHVRDRDGYTLLHIAVTRCMTPPEREKSLQDITEWLLKNGCDPLARDHAGFTPYDRCKEIDAPSWALETLRDRASQHAPNHASSQEYAEHADLWLNRQNLS